MHELRFLSPEWRGNVATEPPSLLFPPLFIFGNEKQPEELKKIYTAYLKNKRTQNVAVLLGDDHPPPMTTQLTAFQEGSNLPLGTIWGVIQLLLRADITTVWNNSMCTVFLTLSVIDHQRTITCWVWTFAPTVKFCTVFRSKTACPGSRPVSSTSLLWKGLYFSRKQTRPEECC